MRFTPAFLDELRARMPISAVVGRKVRLKKEGREWRGLSPFTSEKTPSFFVNDQKGRWFDFSAGKNGNIFDFVMETEGLSFPEAVEKLAGEAGLSLPAVSREEIARETKRTTALDAMEIAARFFEAQLRGKAGEKARAYLTGRGLGEEIQRDFRIGFAPRDRFALRDHLAGQGILRDTMIEGGLLIHGEDIETPYDRFRDRVMFPICDRSGRVIAFGGRTLDPQAPAKYLNSPETKLFHKGAGLFNHHRARRAAHDTGRVIAVEGYVDVIAMTTAGFPESVAPLGTALTPDQCALLWGMSGEPILCFDGDKAGEKAARRAIDTAMPFLSSERTLRFAPLPKGFDPDDLLRAEGPAAIERVIGAPVPLVDMLLRFESARTPLETPEQREGLLRRLGDAVRPISEERFRKAYESDLRGRAFDLFRKLRLKKPSAMPARNGAFGPVHRPPVSEALARSALFRPSEGVSPRIALILTAFLDFPELIEAHSEDLAALSLPAEADRVRQCLLALAHQDHPGPADVSAALDLGLCRPTADRLARLAGPSRLRAAEEGTMPLDAVLSLRQALLLQRRASALNSDLRAAEAELAADLNDRNLKRVGDLRAHLSSLEGMDASVADS